MLKAVLLALTLFSFSNIALTQPVDTLARDTVIRNELLSVNLKRYVGRRVRALLKDPVIAKYKSYSWIDEPPRKLYALYLVYAEGLYVKIVCFPIKHQRDISLTGKFDFTLYKRERISRIEIDMEFFNRKIAKDKSAK